MYSFRSYHVSGTVLNVGDVVVNKPEGDIHRAGETINKIKSEIHSMICLEKKINQQQTLLEFNNRLGFAPKPPPTPPIRRMKIKHNQGYWEAVAFKIIKDRPH